MPKRLERAITQNIVAEVLKQVFLLICGHHDFFDRDDVMDNDADLFPGLIGIQFGQKRNIDGLDKRPKIDFFMA